MNDNSITYNYDLLLSQLASQPGIDSKLLDFIQEGIQQIFEETEELTEYICYLESLLDDHGIPYRRSEI